MGVEDPWRWAVPPDQSLVPQPLHPPGSSGLLGSSPDSVGNANAPPISTGEGRQDPRGQPGDKWPEAAVGERVGGGATAGSCLEATGTQPLVSMWASLPELQTESSRGAVSMWGAGVSLLVELATVLTVPSPLPQVPSTLPAVTGRAGTTHPYRGYLPDKDHSPAMTTLGDTNNSGWMGASGRWVGRGGDLVLPRHHRSVAFPGFLLAAGKHSDSWG